MKIINTIPPNYEEIKKVINPPKDALFPYGDNLYNPSGEEVPADIQFHEAVHIKSQKQFTDPKLWWQKWLMDKDFRLKEELLAYQAQLNFIKHTYPAKAVKEALYEMAENLSNNYKLNIPIHRAESLIRNYKT